MNIARLYKETENKDVESIYRWLRADGFRDVVITKVIHEYALFLQSGIKFGKNEKGLSKLSISIRKRVEELTKTEDVYIIRLYQDIRRLHEPPSGTIRLWLSIGSLLSRMVMGSLKRSLARIGIIKLHEHYC